MEEVHAREQEGAEVLHDVEGPGHGGVAEGNWQEDNFGVIKFCVVGADELDCRGFRFVGSRIYCLQCIKKGSIDTG